jgi:hypothetical protein
VGLLPCPFLFNFAIMKVFDYNLGIWIEESFSEPKRIEKMQMTPTNEKELNHVVHKPKRAKRTNNKTTRPTSAGE